MRVALPITICLFIVLVSNAEARIIPAGPADYTSFLGGLQPGDTLLLAGGTYTNNLTLNGLNGTDTAPIVITGRPSPNTAVFEAQSCCNTVSITKCSYLVVKQLRLSGNDVPVDAVKGEGTAGNWAHHITLEYLDIQGYGSDQQVVGISTKCHAWNWTIRKNRITGAGTGLYLGNSDGDKPFVNGLIEYNLVLNPVGYCMQIKHQNTGVRDAFPGTAVNGRTIIRHNVFCKESNASTGGNARPNVLLGAFPANGWGKDDVYEMYANFIYQNPVEALLQATGNLALYGNVFVNHFDPPGFRAVSVTSQNGFNPRDIRIFHNTVWTANTAGAIRLYAPDPAYRQYCHANAVFSAQPVTNFTDTLDNRVDTYAGASRQVENASTDIQALDLYPRIGMLTGAPTPSGPFMSFTDAGRDFNGSPFSWQYRGAYSGSGANPGWKLQLDTMPDVSSRLLTIREPEKVPALAVYPQPASGEVRVDLDAPCRSCIVKVYDSRGAEMPGPGVTVDGGRDIRLDVRGWPSGLYLVLVHGQRTVTRKVLVR